MENKIKNKHLGSSFEIFLKKEGIWEEVDKLSMKSTYELMTQLMTPHEKKEFDGDYEKLKKEIIENPEKYLEEVVSTDRPTFQAWLEKQMKNPKFREEYEKTEIKLKKNLNVRIDAELIDKVRDIVYFTPSLTLNKFVEDALEYRVFVLGDSPHRPAQLKPGRKVL